MLEVFGVSNSQSQVLTGELVIPKQSNFSIIKIAVSDQAPVECLILAVVYYWNVLKLIFEKCKQILLYDVTLKNKVWQLGFHVTKHLLIVDYQTWIDLEIVQQTDYLMHLSQFILQQSLIVTYYFILYPALIDYIYIIF